MDNDTIDISIKPVVLSNTDIKNAKWTNHIKSIHKGLQSIVLSGDIYKSGLFTQYVKLPANIIEKPHLHHTVRMVTVISGTLYFAYGDQFDESKLKALPEGSYYTEPKGKPHFAMTKGKVILQIIGLGPVKKTEYL